MKIKLACVGCGYFSRFHVEAWLRIPEVELVAICDKDVAKAKKMASDFGIENYHTNLEALIDLEDFSVLDIITPPETHLDICKKAMEAGKHIICQKPLAPEISVAREIVTLAERAAIRFMVHENFRFQPWYRKIKSLIDVGS
ncbi:MAG: Gfo/Idh/MocA family oxidoreductase, partial [Saprospiraceae bacterium]|nr:Gfo/Idh/MocA family oxidoreductase [Saprospiraceae bacterium]